MTDFKTITQEQIDSWIDDDNHGLRIHVHKSHLIDWFNRLPAESEEGKPTEWDFNKGSEEAFTLFDTCPEWWCMGCDEDEFNQAVAERNHLDVDWIEQIEIS